MQYGMGGLGQEHGSARAVGMRIAWFGPYRYGISAGWAMPLADMSYGMARAESTQYSMAWPGPAGWAYHSTGLP